MTVHTHDPIQVATMQNRMKFGALWGNFQQYVCDDVQTSIKRCTCRQFKCLSNAKFILMHGTTFGLGYGPARHWTNEFQNFLVEEFCIRKANIYAPDWGGYNRETVRRQGGLALAAYLKETMGTKTAQPTVIVGYSHGGSAAISALNNLGSNRHFYMSNITLITIATPSREDYRLNENVSIAQHLNFYNTRDTTQILGVLGHGGGISTDWRHHPNAENIQIRDYVPYGITNPLGFPVHRAMHRNPGVWTGYIIPALCSRLCPYNNSKTC